MSDFRGVRRRGYGLLLRLAQQAAGRYDDHVHLLVADQDLLTGRPCHRGRLHPHHLIIARKQT